MKPIAVILRILLIIVLAGAVAFEGLLYNFCEKQRLAMENLSKQQQAQIQDDSNQFKYQQQQLERLNHSVDGAMQQLNEQRDALADEVGRREQIESDDKTIQTSLVDIKAEADAIKQDMKGWQKDYVAVLAQLEKKMDVTQYEMKSFEDNLRGLNIPRLEDDIRTIKADMETMAHPAPAIQDNADSATVNAADNTNSQALPAAY